MKHLLIIAAWLSLLTQNTTIAGEVTSQILTNGSTSWDGGTINYPQKSPEITVQKITITTDGSDVILPIHCHTIPLAAYVLKGGLKVIKTTGEEKQFKAGDAFIEVMKSWHKGVFTENAELIVFYVGKKSVPLSIKSEADTDLSQPCD